MCPATARYATTILVFSVATRAELHPITSIINKLRRSHSFRFSLARASVLGQFMRCCCLWCVLQVETIVIADTTMTNTTNIKVGASMPIKKAYPVALHLENHIYRYILHYIPGMPTVIRFMNLRKEMYSMIQAVVGGNTDYSQEKWHNCMRYRKESIVTTIRCSRSEPFPRTPRHHDGLDRVVQWLR